VALKIKEDAHCSIFFILEQFFLINIFLINTHLKLFELFELFEQ